jgi:hypothetical protein
VCKIILFLERFVEKFQNSDLDDFDDVESGDEVDEVADDELDDETILFTGESDTDEDRAVQDG